MMGFLDTLNEETTMGENKGHGTKGPSYDQLNDMDTNVQRDKLNQEQQGGQQSGQKQQGGQQSGQQQGSQQSGQQSGQQRGGQHASGGTPALDDLGSRQGESAKDASQAWNQDNSSDKQRGNR